MSTPPLSYTITPNAVIEPRRITGAPPPELARMVIDSPLPSHKLPQRSPRPTDDCSVRLCKLTCVSGRASLYLSQSSRFCVIVASPPCATTLCVTASSRVATSTHRCAASLRPCARLCAVCLTSDTRVCSQINSIRTICQWASTQTASQAGAKPRASLSTLTVTLFGTY